MGHCESSHKKIHSSEKLIIASVQGVPLLISDVVPAFVRAVILANKCVGAWVRIIILVIFRGFSCVGVLAFS